MKTPKPKNRANKMRDRTNLKTTNYSKTNPKNKTRMWIRNKKKGKKNRKDQAARNTRNFQTWINNNLTC